MKDIKLIKRERRHKRVRAKVFGTAQRPRLAIFRSARHIYAQIINDEEKKTLVSASDLKLKKSDKGKLSLASDVGKAIAEACTKAKIKKVVFDRGGFKYHGRVKALAEAAREGGLEF